MVTDDQFRRERKRSYAQLVADYAAGDLASAGRRVSQLVTDYPERPEAHVVAAEYHLERHDPEAAVDAYSRAISLVPDGWSARLRLAQLLVALDRDEEAFEILEPAAAQLHREALCEFAALCRRTGRNDQAIDTLKAVVARWPRLAPARDDLIAALAEAGLHTEAEEVQRARDAQLASKLSLADAVRRIDGASAGAAERYVVNVGCRDGRGMADPCFELYQAGYAGLAIDAGAFPHLYFNLPQPAIRKLLYTPLTPLNTREILSREGCPPRFSALKIDIDGYDGILLQAILEDYEPNVIQIEVNPEIPPPIKFSIQYDPRYRHSGQFGFFGCSLAFATAVARPRGYELLQIDLGDPPIRQDALLVKSECLGLFGVPAPVDERELYLREPAISRRFAKLGYDTAAWRERTDYYAVASEVWDACVEASMRRSNKALPFVLAVY